MELQQGRAYQPWFLIVEKGRPARSTQVCKVNSLFIFSFFLYLLGSTPACIARLCSSIVAIFHVWFMCEQEWVRWEVSPGFWYSSMLQLCVQVPHMLSHGQLLTDTHSLPALKYMHKCSFFTSSDSSIKPSTDHTHLCLLYRCGWRKGRQCVVRNLSSSMWGAGGLAHWDPRLAYCDQQPAWRLGESSKTNSCKCIICMLVFVCCV